VRANCLKGAPAIGKPVIPGGATDSLLPGFGHCLAFCTQGGENSREKSQMSWLSAPITTAAYFVAKNYVPAGQALCLKGQKLCPTPHLEADKVVGRASPIDKRLTSRWDILAVAVGTKWLAFRCSSDKLFVPEI